MNQENELTLLKKQWHGSLSSYVIGFVGSLILTMLAYLSVGQRWLRSSSLFCFIVGLALLQAAFQLVFFLHVRKENKPRWGAMLLTMLVIVLVILVFGSLWIIFNLNERVM